LRYEYCIFHRESSLLLDYFIPPELNVPVTFPAIYPNSLRLSPTFKLLWSAINTSWVAIRCEAVSNGGNTSFPGIFTQSLTIAFSGYVSVGFGPDDLGSTHRSAVSVPM